MGATDQFDNEASLREALARMPIERLIAEFGYGPKNENWKTFDCPFCKRKDKAGVFTATGTSDRLFKCFDNSCEANKAMGPVQFLKRVRGLATDRDAFIDFLKMAGVWKERERFKPPEPKLPPGESSPLNEAGEEEQLVKQCVETIREEQKASVSLLQRRFRIGYTRAARIMDELEKRGIVGPSKGAEPRDILNLPAAPPEPPPIPPEVPRGAEPIENKPIVTDGTGYTYLTELYSKLPITTQQLSPYLPNGQKVPSPLPDAVGRLLKFRPVSLFAKRGLIPETCAALGFKANARSNRTLMLELSMKYAWEELKASGVWQSGDKQKRRRPNAQYYGFGQIGKKPREERKSGNDKMLWGWCEPVLIPYFDREGKLIALRPHKGGAAAGTAASAMHLYVPRIGGTVNEENFQVVILTEGEFKAAAIWQTLGTGRLINPQWPTYDGNPAIGVGALPGIYFADHVAIRQELEDWLADVGCRRVIVAYDYEEKGNPDLTEAFQPDQRKRFDAQIQARYLATDLANKLRIRGEVCVLPRDWQNEKGKADWDSALAQFVFAA